MDLLAYEAGEMYFDVPLDAKAETLIQQAGKTYGEPEAEGFLREALKIAPQHLTVLVALYRFHFYRHQHAEALAIATQALEIVARRLDIAPDWRDVSLNDMSSAANTGVELVRFYLHALKGAGYLLLRLGDCERGLARFDKVAELDPKDRIGAAALAEVAREALGSSAA